MSIDRENRESVIMEAAGELGFLAKLSPVDLMALEQFIDRRTEESIRTNVFLQKLSAVLVGSNLANETLTTVAAKTGASPEDAMVLALTLYDIAVDAMRQGQRLVLVDKDYRFVREVTGLVEEKTDPHERVAG